MTVFEMLKALEKVDGHAKIMASVGSPLGSEDCEIEEALIDEQTGDVYLLVLQEFKEEDA